MSHYYLAHPEKLEKALAEHYDEHCAKHGMTPEQAGVMKEIVRTFLDSPAARKHGIRIEVKDPVLPKASVT